MSSSTACSNHQQSASKNTWMPEKIWRVARDIQDAPKIDLLSLLTAFLARMLVEDVENEESETYSEAVKRSKSIINVMHRDAIAFCKEEDNERATSVKEYLYKYRRAKEQKRRSSTLCTALNTALSEFRNKQYGDLPIPSQHNDKDELIFIPNDLASLEAEHIANHMPRSKRTPDILATSTTRLKRNFDHEGVGFEGWTRLVETEELFKTPGSSRKLQWLDVHQAWDLVVTRIDDASLPVKDDEEIEKNLQVYNTQTQSHSGQQRNSRKRRSEEDQSTGKSKKARVESGSEPKPFRLQVSDEKFNLLPELRCAYYGAERLSSSWIVNHSTMVLLEDTKLTLRWYDAQGCFESEEIDIVENMSTFVVFLVVLQRFDNRLWGLSSENADFVEMDEDSFKLEEGRCRFELTGRRTFGCTALRVSKASDEVFFKSSWVKCNDPKEPDIIKTAHERANSRLPEKFQKMVTDHIPTVIASRISSTDSTSVIRRLVQQVDVATQFTGKPRERVWIITRKLDPTHELDPADFWKVFWELVRCHYLLWMIGIAHRDISISNLMCGKLDGELIGVLNDYDLAIVMEPGSRNPESDGYERGGTTPFMSVDLLDYREGQLTRWYRHDLESFTWCLLWQMLRSPPHSWSEGSVDDIFKSKRYSMITIGDLMSKVKDNWLPFFLFVMTWIESWRDAFQSLDGDNVHTCIATGIRRSDKEKILLRDARDEKKEDREYLLQSMDDALETIRSEHADLSMMRDASWIHVELN